MKTGAKIRMSEDRKNVVLRLSDQEMERVCAFVEEMRAHYMKGEDREACLPWTHDEFTKAQLREWLASREQAAGAIDVESCEIGWWYANILDPYGIYEALGELRDDEMCFGRNQFVRSSASRGWISTHDLPPDKFAVLQARIERGGAMKS
jgi:hypothetical protein